MATITKRGTRWRVQVRRKGYKQVSQTFASQAEARRWAAQVEGKMAAQDWVDLSAARRTTLGEALRRYLEEVTPTKKGIRQERLRVLAWLRDPLAERPLAAIRSEDIAEWRKARQLLGKAPTTIKNAVTIISQVVKTAKSEWSMPGLANPVAGVRMPGNRPHRERRLEGDEEARILPCAMHASSRSSDWPWRRRCGKASCCAWSGTTSEAAVQHSWRKACRRAGIADLRFHDLRHEATSRLFERGLDAFEIMAITGHSTTDMLKRYTHFRAEELAAKLG